MMQGTANKTSAGFTHCVRSHILHVTLGNPQTFGFESHLRLLPSGRWSVKQLVALLFAIPC